MCGICGFWAVALNDEKKHEILRGMSTLISHRGPDDYGYYENKHVSFAHRRLSIIDKKGGKQPMLSMNKDVAIIYNGEIYNFRELRQEFQAKGYCFQSHSDTEVILAGYILIGEEIFERINGMFAVAIWDATQQKMLLARDRLGIKPLYYTSLGSDLYFASEIKALLYATSKKTINEESLGQFLSYGYVPQNETLIEGVHCLAPGTILTFKNGIIQHRQYWSHQYTQVSSKDPREYLREFSFQIERAVQRRMVSDVPVGAFLSGGVDSSLIVALMAQQSSSPIKTFSIGFNEEGGNEFTYSRMVAEQFQTDHTEVIYTEEDFLHLLCDAIWFQDEPLRHDASVPLLHLARQAKKKATVILSGEGADEIFLGYAKFLRAKQVSNIIPFLPHSCKRLFIEKNLQSIPYYKSRSLLSSGLQLPRSTGMIEDFDKSEAPTWVEKIADVDCRNYLISLLMKQDKMTMAAAIESRVPFLDHELVEWGHNVPLSLKFKGQTGKYLVKKMAEDFFPKAFLHRTKMGFPVPLDSWMSSGQLRTWMMDIFSSASFKQRGYFDAEKTAQSLQTFPKLTETRFFHSRSLQRTMLWRVFNFELWAKLFIDTDSADLISKRMVTDVHQPNCNKT